MKFIKSKLQDLFFIESPKFDPGTMSFINWRCASNIFDENHAFEKYHVFCMGIINVGLAAIYFLENYNKIVSF